MKRIKHFKVLSIAVAFILVFSVVFPLSTRAENSSEEKFTAEQSINGTKVTVSADPEVFPEGTTMEVKEVNLTSTEDSLVASQQQADQKSIKKVALDITMMNKEGQEIEPDTSKGKVHVSFTNDDIKNHTTNVYHIDDNLKVESLKLTKSDDTVTGETTGFSTYVLEFAIGQKIIYYNTGELKKTEFSLGTVVSDLLGIDNSKISNIQPVDSQGRYSKDYQSYADFSPANNYSLKFTEAFPPDGAGLRFKIDYKDNSNNNATATLIVRLPNKTLSNVDLFNNYNAAEDDDTKTITLYHYIGSDPKPEVPATVNVNGIDYHVAINGSVYKKTSITSVKFIKNNKGEKVQAINSLKELFSECESLEQVDFTGLDTSNVTDMSLLFNKAKSLKTVDLSALNTSKVTNMSLFFSGAIELTSVDLSKLDTSKVTNMSSFFSGATSLTNVNLSNLNTSNVTDMTAMFSNTGLISLDLSKFNTQNVTELNNLASGNKKLKEINLSSFEGAKSGYATIPDVSKWSGPLNNDPNLERVILGANWKAVDYTTYIGLGLAGNWQNIQTAVVYTNEELDNSFISSMAGTYIKTNLPPTSINRALYVADGYQKEDNMWEVHTPQDKFRAYCLDHKRLPPSGYFDKIEIDVNATKNTNEKGYSNYIMDYLDAGNTGYREIAPNMAKALVALIYYSDFSGNKGYNQNDIWHFTNDYSSGISASLQAKIDGKNSDGTSIGKKRTYESIGKDYKLFIYVPSEYNTSPDKNKMQNLLSIEGATDRTYAGVQVKKVDNNSNGLFGAKFKVSKKDGSEIVDGKKSLEFTTNTTGIGGIYRMDRTSGLTVGTYILEEKEAPSGYLKNENNKFEFTVTDDDNQKVITVGNENNVIINNPIPNWHGGGLTLKKVDAKTGAGLQNAEFTLYRIKDDNTEEEVKKYTTDSSGVLYTGNKELEIGKKYIIRETKAPDGYVNANFSKEITLTTSDQNKYLALGSIVNNSKVGSITLTAKKILKNSNETLKANQFTFQLYDSNHNPIGNPKGNAEDGTITFDTLNFTAADMPGKTYYIKEDIPANKDASLDYDTHEERVQVLISDDGTDILKCTAQTDNDGITFVNTSKVNYNGKLTVNKIVKDSFGEVIQGNSGGSFDFYLNLVSDTADLDTKTFNYTLDNKSGTFKLNKAGNTEDGKTKYRSQSSFKLSNGSKLELTLLPVGASYEVIEDDYSSNGYSTSVVANTEIAETDNTKNYQPTVDNAARKASGEISLAGDSITYTNSQQRIIPTSADTMTRMSFWILGTAGALVFVLILKRRLKASKK
ncbi:SpaA isopeptide-forming pilin-related protein [Sharpea porci]|uniref:SpaA isopeptide-forming pilin-related protein n=1 Tax=Sharpea porci TaxID=2652286 RepID=UPI002A91735C|nr:BspA family leucine-rich repeat surface protein [Sharpea porci]MDY5279133.1 BspA family leucine-rich repeat surface protein [Sharpea porci]